MLRNICRFRGNVFLSRARGQSPSEYSQSKLDDGELIGIEGEGAPIAKLLVAIASQARSDKMAAVSFDFSAGLDHFSVLFWESCPTFHLGGDSLEAMTIPRNLAKPLLSHALWILNHQDPMFEVTRGTFLFDDPTYDPAKWPQSAPKCRCWLRNPTDITSLVIQILE